MVGVMIGAVVLLADAVFLYCCLRIGSEADRRMREELEKNETGLGKRSWQSVIKLNNQLSSCPALGREHELKLMKRKRL